jgi:MFS family permease
MSATEKRATFSLASIYALRMLGLFLIMPVFALYAEHLADVTPLLVGLAIGIYGLTQALLQIPFGMLSDRIGRKPVIVGGLTLFAIGSVVAAMSDSITGVIIGRALQGSGAIAAAVMALVADSTRESSRTKAMALIGISIGMAFMIALVAGPILYKSISVPGMFWLTAALAVAGILVILFVVPTPEHQATHRDAEVVSGQVSRVLGNIDLLRLDLGIFVLHLIMTALFLAYPLLLRDMGGIASEDHWTIYLPVLVLSIMLMVPFIILAEKRGKIKQVFLLAIMALALGLFGIGELASDKWGLVGWLLLFFTAFNLLEASLPSLISKIAPADAKGTAMGVYSTSQFAGAFVGGTAGGWIHQQFGAQAVLLFGAGMAVLWLLFAFGMKAPEPLKPRLINIRNMPGSSAEISELFYRIAGVREVVIAPDEGVAYLKVDSKKLDKEALEAMEASA